MCIKIHFSSSLGIPGRNGDRALERKFCIGTQNNLNSVLHWGEKLWLPVEMSKEATL